MIAGAYLAGTNTRRVRRALNAVFAGPVGKDVVSRRRKTKGDWDAWNARSLAEEPIVRLILDGTVARVRLDRRATLDSLLIALGVRADGQKVSLAIKSMGGEGEAAWRALLDDLVRRGLPTPELVVVDGAPGLGKGAGGAVARHGLSAPSVRDYLSPMRPSACTRKFERLPRHDLRRDARRGRDPRARRSSGKWRLKSSVVADSPEQLGDKLFIFTRFPPNNGNRSEP